MACRGLRKARLIRSNDRLAYDLYSTFIDYLDTARVGVVSSGALLSSVEQYGLDRAFFEALGTDLDSLLEGWRMYVAQRFATEPDCGAEEREAARIRGTTSALP